MRILSIVLLALLTAGCEHFHRPLLGARVHRFTVGGTNFVHCSILIDQAQTQLAHDSIQVCTDEIGAKPEPERMK